MKTKEQATLEITYPRDDARHSGAVFAVLFELCVALSFGRAPGALGAGEHRRGLDEVPRRRAGTEHTAADPRDHRAVRPAKDRKAQETAYSSIRQFWCSDSV